MSSAEGIVNVDVAQACQLLGKLRVVLLFALVEAKVLEKTYVTVLQSGNGCLGRLADGVGCKGDGLAKNLGKVLSHRLQGELSLVARSFRTAQVAAQHDLGTALDKRLDGGKRRLDSRIVGYRGAIERHVEVNTAQYALACNIGIGKRFHIAHC